MSLDQHYAIVFSHLVYPGISVLILAGIQWLIAVWLKSTITASIKHEYDKKLAEFQYELRIREQAVKIAEFFSEWSKNNADINKLNNMSMELSLWLPADIYKDLAKCLTYAPGAPLAKDILIAVRKHLLKNSAGDLTAPEIIHFN
jgi:hypothetical protein